MAESALPIGAVAASVAAHWGAEFAHPTLYGGERRDPGGWPGWAEFWAHAFPSGAQRRSGPPQIGLLVTVHLLARPGSDAGWIHDLADEGRRALSQRAIDVVDFEASGHPRIGVLRLGEVDVQDWSRGEAGERGTGLRHLVLTCRGAATGIEGGA